MPTIPNRQYTQEFQEAAVTQVLEGSRSLAEVSRSLEMADKTLALGSAERGGDNHSPTVDGLLR